MSPDEERRELWRLIRLCEIVLEHYDLTLGDKDGRGDLARLALRRIERGLSVELGKARSPGVKT